jgi:hypothetical protein
MTNHICDRIDVAWAPSPSWKEDEGIRWYGVCNVCKRPVYELYTTDLRLLDVETGEEITKGMHHEYPNQSR